jgi:hypothetical protein
MGIRTPATIAPGRAPWAISQRKAEGLPLRPTPALVSIEDMPDGISSFRIFALLKNLDFEFSRC